MPICANDAADMDSRTRVNNIVRMKRICLVSPLARSSFACPVSLCGCGLRGLKGTISGRNVLKAHLAPKWFSRKLSHFGNVKVCAKKLTSSIRPQAIAARTSACRLLALCSLPCRSSCRPAGELCCKVPCLSLRLFTLCRHKVASEQTATAQVLRVRAGQHVGIAQLKSWTHRRSKDMG